MRALGRAAGPSRAPLRSHTARFAPPPCPHPPLGLGGIHTRAQIGPWRKSSREAGGHGEAKGNGISPPPQPARHPRGGCEEQPRGVVRSSLGT